MHTMVALRGTVTIVHRAETLGKILDAMENRFGDIRIAPLYAREGTAASRVIVQGIKGSKAPMQLLPGLILHTKIPSSPPMPKPSCAMAQPGACANQTRIRRNQCL